MNRDPAAAVTAAGRSLSHRETEMADIIDFEARLKKLRAARMAEKVTAAEQVELIGEWIMTDLPLKISLFGVKKIK